MIVTRCSTSDPFGGWEDVNPPVFRALEAAADADRSSSPVAVRRVVTAEPV